MSATAEHFASLDSRVAEIRAAWDAERTALQHRIMELETELTIRTKLHEDAIQGKDEAMRTTVKLLTQFGIVATVFDEAKQVAMAAGLYSDQNVLTPSADANKELIDKVTGASDVQT